VRGFVCSVRVRLLNFCQFRILPRRKKIQKRPPHTHFQTLTKKRPETKTEDNNKRQEQRRDRRRDPRQYQRQDERQDQDLSLPSPLPLSSSNDIPVIAWMLSCTSLTLTLTLERAKRGVSCHWMGKWNGWDKERKRRHQEENKFKGKVKGALDKKRHR
jgi:hypothetical protein